MVPFGVVWHSSFEKPQGLGKICLRKTSNEQQTACYKWLQWTVEKQIVKPNLHSTVRSDYKVKL